MQTTSTQSQTPLRAVRESQGRSLRSVARETDLDAAHLSRIERGLSQPSIATLRRLSLALGLGDLAASLWPYVCDDGDRVSDGQATKYERRPA